MGYDPCLTCTEDQVPPTPPSCTSLLPCHSLKLRSLCCQLQWAPHKARMLISVFVVHITASLPGLWVQEARHYPLLVTEVPNATYYPC